MESRFVPAWVGIISLFKVKFKVLFLIVLLDLAVKALFFSATEKF